MLFLFIIKNESLCKIIFYATKVIIKYEKTLSFSGKKNFLQCRHAFFSVLLQNIIVFLLTLQKKLILHQNINEYLDIL